MEDKANPDLEKTCRLCLCNLSDSEAIDIFPASGSDDNVSMQVSIPMRVMACAALEVRAGDGLPKSICSECQYQLEKSYYFRKRSQLSDTKLRKHIRLLSLGRKSFVFSNNLDDDELADELEFEDSIKFIRERERKKQAEETAIWEQRLQNELEEKLILAKDEWIDQYRVEIKEEVGNELRSSVIDEVKEELRAEMEQEIRMTLREECKEQAKLELRAEVLKECREEERASLLDDLQEFLKRKKDENPPVKANNKCTAIVNNIKKSKNNLKSVKKTMQIIKHNEATFLSHETVENDEMCSGSQAEVDGEDISDEPEFYLIESMNGQEEGSTIVTSRSSKKRQTIEQSQRFEYFEDKTGTANFRLTASENSSREHEVESYHHTGEIEMMSKVHDENEQDAENDDENVEDGVMVFNIAADLESEAVESMNLEEYDMKSSVSVNDENATNDKPLFTKSTDTECDETKQNSAFPVYLRKSDTLKSFKCDSCPIVFSTKNSMHRHMRTHAKSEQRGISHQCNVCHVLLSCKSALTRHMIIHTGVKPHSCDHCGKSFVQREVLKRHLLTHSGTKAYICTECGRKFTYKHSLQNHTMREHSDKPVRQKHACHLCPKRFHHMSGLSRHLVSHTGLIYQCVECERKFSDRSSVKRHIMTKHGGEKNAAFRSFREQEVKNDPGEDGNLEGSEDNDTAYLV